jgi:DNA (cytosine-5)-methyltransferase 1
MTTFGSVCSGIEAASVAWHPLGWRAAWLAEIEPFPSAVLAHHYPDVPNLGDMTKLPERISSGEVPAPDVFCGGTPCQAFSVAGLRKSLDDARGNLSLIFCEIANAIDTVRAGRGDPPAIIFWENVPGVLSTKDNAFGCFLAALAGEDDALEPPGGGGWSNAGYVSGPQRTIAWRTLDAQYFGLAQRRRRVFVVASARDDFDPAAVLFEFSGVRRDSAPSREAGQSIAPAVTAGAPNGGAAHGARSGSAKEGLIVPVQPYEVGNCLTARMHKGINSTLDEGQTPVLQPIPLDMRNAGRDPEKHDEMNRQGVGVGEPGDPAHTVTSAFVHAVAQPIAFSAKDHGADATADLSPTLRAMGHADSHANGGGQMAVAIGLDQELNGRVELAGTLQRKGEGGFQGSVMTPAMAVRRLTPVECERLQGFPDNYTNIPWSAAKEATRKGISYEAVLALRGMTLRGPNLEDCPDGPRYKALGNSWAVPNVRWIGARIKDALQEAEQKRKS